MNLDKKDIEILKALVKQKLKRLKEEGSKILRPGVAMLSAEERYEEFLEQLLKKLK